MSLHYVLDVPGLPRPKGHYSYAVVQNGQVSTAGLLPIGPDGQAMNGEIEEEARCVLHHLHNVLAAAGSDFHHLVKVTVYISDVSLWGRFNAVYAEMLGEARPARAVVPVPELHYGCKLEIEATAIVRAW